VLPGAGNSGSRIAHSASVTDDEYTAQPCPPAAWGGHDGHGEIGDDGIVGSWSGRGLGNHRPNQEPTSSVLREAHARPSRVLKHSLTERRRSFVIAHALGATRRHLRSFVLAETAILVACGLAAGAILGAALSQMLVRVLTGIFDPPPTALSVPWTYLAAIAVVLIVAISAVSGVTIRLARRSPLTVLGEL
jgi:hypothetical protein